MPRSRRAPRSPDRPPPTAPALAGAFAARTWPGTAAALAPSPGPRWVGPLAVAEVEMRGGLMVPPVALPWLRLREVVFHHVDLADGFTVRGRGARGGAPASSPTR